MTKRVLVGAGIFVAAYAVYRIKTLPTQIVTAPGGQQVTQRLGSAIYLGDPFLYVVALAGAVAGKVFS